MNVIDSNNGDDGLTSSKAFSDHDTGPVIARPVTGGYGPSDNRAHMNPKAQPLGVAGADKPVARDVPVAAGASRPADAGAAHASGDTREGPATPALPVHAGTSVIDDVLDDVPRSSPLSTQTAMIFGMSARDAQMLLEDAEKYLRDDAAARRIRMNTPPSGKTENLYRRKLRNMIDVHAERGDHTGHLAMDLLLPFAKSRQTHKVMRAALKWHLLRRIEHRVAELNDAAQNKEPLLMHSCLSLERALEVVGELDGLSYQDLLDYLQQSPRPPGSRRMTLKKLEIEERERFLVEAERSNTYRLADTVMSYCGMRPCELEKGVALEWRDDSIVVTIQGGKVRDGVAGQAWRRMRLGSAMLPAWFVEHVRTNKVVNVTAEPNAMRKHLERLGPSVLSPTRGRSKNLTAYAFRHALVTDLRDEGWTAEEIAVVIGEQSAETVASYGLRRHGTGKVRPRVAIDRASIKAASVVKPLDNSGLKTLLSGKARSKSQMARR